MTVTRSTNLGKCIQYIAIDRLQLCNILQHETIKATLAGLLFLIHE